MELYQAYNLGKNQADFRNKFGAGSAIDRYIIAKVQKNNRRIILDPAAYDSMVQAAAADISAAVLHCFKG